jgi:hypothetical protein
VGLVDSLVAFHLVEVALVAMVATVTVVTVVVSVVSEVEVLMTTMSILDKQNLAHLIVDFYKGVCLSRKPKTKRELHLWEPRTANLNRCSCA